MDPHNFIDIDLIRDTAVAVRNLQGDYVAENITGAELNFALRLLEDIIPTFILKVQDAEVKQRIADIKNEVKKIHDSEGCNGFCAYCAEQKKENV